MVSGRICFRSILIFLSVRFWLMLLRVYICSTFYVFCSEHVSSFRILSLLHCYCLFLSTVYLNLYCTAELLMQSLQSTPWSLDVYRFYHHYSPLTCIYHHFVLPLYLQFSFIQINFHFWFINSSSLAVHVHSFYVSIPSWYFLYSMNHHFFNVISSDFFFLFLIKFTSSSQMIHLGYCIGSFLHIHIFWTE